MVLCMRHGTCHFGKIPDYGWGWVLSLELELNTWLRIAERMDTELSYEINCFGSEDAYCCVEIIICAQILFLHVILSTLQIPRHLKDYVWRIIISCTGSL